MTLRTDKHYVANINKVFDNKTNKWVDKPNIANIGKIIDERFIRVKSTSPIIRGMKIDSIDIQRNSYIRQDIATINYELYDDAIRSLQKSDYEVWKIIKDYICQNNITIKLNISIIKNWTNIKDDSNAHKVIKRLLKSGLIIKAKDYKDLYAVNPKIYFRGNYNKLAIDYINAGYNENDLIEPSDWCDVSNQITI